MSEATKAAGTAPAGPAPVTRIARRHARQGHEAEYEARIREMFVKLRAFHGFMGADLIPPEQPGGCYQVVVNFASEADLQAWDDSAVRTEMHKRIREVAEDEPDYRRLSGLEAWFAGVVVPASMHPPRFRMAVVTWMGIFPVVSFYLWLVSLWPGFFEQPFLPRTAVFTAVIVVTMTWVVMPRLTKLMRGWLNPQQK
ncbi:antibiotic biosynthesis monooxygenase [Thauera sinica]|uniref:Antibiotic biosynthesis monooxygenase n=1 Tax=Thauera sinica TaxID=2665146 RepID=A0ABW1AUE2_9RHOO|nr:antibiotic biosynthesis monooxygenase [Thauera sp. K11]ATE59328.1 antibiotic biosynthesis monooxygenase [Thauera sp. K11]